MAVYNKFEVFSENLAKKVHDCHADLFKVYLSNALPSTSADSIKTDLAEIAGGSGYTATGHDTQNTVTRSGITSTVNAVDIVITASGGTVGPFQYAVLYNDTPASPLDPLIAWWDYGSAISLLDGESLTIDFGSNSLFTVA